MFEYNEVFRAIEKSLLTSGNKIKPMADIQAELDVFKTFESRELDDNQYYEILVFVTFYSGFRAATVTSKSDIIKSHFPGYEKVAAYTDVDIDRIMNDQRMIKNIKKITACIENAKTIKEIVEKYGSMKNYIDSFNSRPTSPISLDKRPLSGPIDYFENLILLKEELEAKFSYLSGITVYHFLTDIGMQVLKPDRVICRIFKRLGLIENSSQLLKTIIHGRRFSEATKLPIRYIDIVLVAYGQVQSLAFGIEKGICLEAPCCFECGVKKYCKYDPLTPEV